MVQFWFGIYKRYADRFPTVNQFIKFCLVGAANAVLDFSVYLGLTRFFVFWQSHLLAANFIAVFIASLSSFFLNKYFTFHNQSRQFVRQYTKFVIVSAVYIGLVQLVLYVCIELLSWYDLWGKVMASAVGLVWNFTAHKFWSFRPSKHQLSGEN